MHSGFVTLLQAKVFGSVFGLSTSLPESQTYLASVIRAPKWFNIYHEPSRDSPTTTTTRELCVLHKVLVSPHVCESIA
jgi:hypothetical protein